MIYSYKGIQLRAIEESDLEMLRGMINDPVIEIMTGGFSFPVSEYQQRKWFEKIVQNEKEVRTVIDTHEYGPIGMVALTDIDWRNRTAQFHSKIIADKSVQGKGYGTKATIALLKYAFEEMNLHLVYSHTLEYNAASQKVKEKCGFRKECFLRDRVFKNGTYHGVIVWSILKGELIE